MNKFRKFYDISQPVYDNCPGWPTYEVTTVRNEAFHERDHFNAEQIRLNSHTGTHLDAPYHFFPDGITIDRMPVELFQGEAVLADLRGKISAKEGIRTEHLKPYENLIREGVIVLLNTGWGEKRGFGEDYIHDWPYLTGEAARWLCGRGIKGVGIDAMSIGGWYEGTGRPCHEELLSHGVWALEEIRLPDELMEHRTCYLMAFPLKLQGFSGAPARAVAAV
ncbi:MAG: cyclase family protein [Eubacteriales bacterium]|nr:cyclase family protein [Eubacteriales bacterium]